MKSQKIRPIFVEEMTRNALIIGLIVLAIIIAIVVPMVHKSAEGFNGSGVALYDSLDRPGYLDYAMKSSNPLASVMDPTKINLAKSDDPNVVNAMSQEIQDTMNTSMLTPNPESLTYLGLQTAVTTATLPPPNQIIAEAKKCQKLTGRDACAALKDKGTYGKCGICLKEGTPYSETDPNPYEGKWIGGLLVLPDDQKRAETAAGPNKQPTYSATVGDCPGGKLYVDADICTKEANRLDCLEFGNTGGFGVPSAANSSGKTTYTGVGNTVEGKTPTTCAQIAASKEGKTYIYEPQDRKTSVNLRVTFPYGTGYHRVRVFDSDNRQVGSADSTETTLLLTINAAAELSKYRVYIGMETPHMHSGQKEAFMFNRDLGNGGGYNQTQSSAADVCSSIGARQATGNEAQDAFNNGAQSCFCAWTTTINGYPSQAALGGCGGIGINNCAGGESWGAGVHGASWCFGVKPPKNGGDANLKLNSSPVPWFGTYGKDSTPSQSSQPTTWSRFNGGEYEAPHFRGFVAQWEMASGSTAKRTVPFEPTIVGVNGNAPQAVAADGLKTFTTLRRFGTFSGSTTIKGPRPKAVPQMLTNQFWIWSNQAEQASAYFDVQLPNIFMDSYYPEDRVDSKAGYLIGKPFSMTLMATSPCLAVDQVAGNYSEPCLRSMFIGSGGDPNAGKLASAETGGLLQLNKIGDGSIDAISGYLSGLYELIMTGKDSNGYPVGMSANGKLDPKAGRKKINEASQLMFGFDMVSPCEYMSQDNAGNIVINQNPANGEGTLDAACMDYLFMNTYSSNARENSGNKGNGSTIRGTYTNSYPGFPQTLAVRYSGLRDREGKEADRDKWPFQACQRTGTLSPLKPDGTTVNAAAVKYVNNQAYPVVGPGKSMVQAVQDIYDAWHKAANYYTNALQTDEATASANASVGEIAMTLCYGISKSASATSRTGCGVKARYVRVMGSWRSMSNNQCLQIPQIQVFTTDGLEVAKGKKATTNSQWPDNFSTPDKAVNGNATPHSHGSGEFHSACDGNGGNKAAYNSYWMVDLGGTYEISSIKFFPRTDCCQQRQFMSPVQLLNDSMNVVAEQRIWDNVDVAGVNWNAPFTMPFSGKLLTPRFNLSDLIAAGAGKADPIPTTLCNATTGTGYVLSISGGLWSQLRMVNVGVNKSKVPSGEVTNSTMYVYPSFTGESGTISFYWAGWGYGGYLCHSGTALWMRPNGTGLAPDSSFKPVPAINGDPAGYSIQGTTAGYTNHYLVNHWNGNENMVGIQTINMNDPTDMRRAVWFINNGLNSLKYPAGNYLPPFTGQPTYGNIGY